MTSSFVVGPKRQMERFREPLPDGTGTALPITQASLYFAGHNHMSIGEKKGLSI